MQHHYGLTKRSVGIPKGFLFYGVLRMLSQKPMSGSELAEEIDRKTGWRPSPGSIYPLLAKLKERLYVEEVESQEAGLKRFVLTDKGRGLLSEYETKEEIFGRKFHSIRRIWFRLYREMDEEFYQASMNLFEAIERVSPYLKGEEAKEAAGAVRSIIVKATEDIKTLMRELESKRRSTI